MGWNEGSKLLHLSLQITSASLCHPAHPEGRKHDGNLWLEATRWLWPTQAKKKNLSNRNWIDNSCVTSQWSLPGHQEDPSWVPGSLKITAAAKIQISPHILPKPFRTTGRVNNTTMLPAPNPTISMVKIPFFFFLGLPNFFRVDRFSTVFLSTW